MRKNTVKTLAVVLATTMAATMVTACTKSQTEKDTPATESIGTETQSQLAAQGTEAQTDAASTEESSTDEDLPGADETPAVSEDDTAASIEVSVDIEGISDTFYVGTITTQSTTVLEVLEEIVTNNDSQSLSATINDGYLSAINEDVAGTFGGWDGWMYRVNNEEPAFAMGEYELSDGDDIIIYYGDPYGIGMQYPQLSVDGTVVCLTSTDVTYDADGNASVAENPIADATVTWYGTEYTTDENGCFSLEEEAVLPQSLHGADITIQKYAENGCPLVLRTLCAIHE